MLLDAQELSRSDPVYNLFAGPYYRAWRDIRYLSDPEDFDPLRSDTERERLQRLLKAAEEPGACAIVPVDEEKHILRLEISEDYLALLRETEQEGPVVDLGVLHDAYELRFCATRWCAPATATAISAWPAASPRCCPAIRGRAQPLRTNRRGRDSGGGDPGCRRGARRGGSRALPGRRESRTTMSSTACSAPSWLPASGEYRSLLLGALVVADDPVEAVLAESPQQRTAHQPTSGELGSLLRRGRSRTSSATGSRLSIPTATRSPPARTTDGRPFEVRNWR